MTTSSFQEIGQITKAHGLDGVLIFRSDLPYPDELYRIPVFYVSDPRGNMIPQRVESLKETKQKGYDMFFVKFETIHNRSEAETLRNQSVFVNTVMHEITLEDEVDSLERMIGWSVSDDVSLFSGIVDEVFENPMQVILNVAYNDQVVLIPVVDEYIVSIDDDSQHIQVQNIDRLLEI